MPATVAHTRCLRCGTIIRNNRPACPCCGGEEIGTVETRVSGASGSDPGGARTSGDASQMCPICLGTVLKDQMVDFKGQMVCPNCQQTMAAKG